MLWWDFCINNVHEKLLNSDWLRKECKMCNTSAKSLIQWKLHSEINNRYLVSTNKVAVVVVKITIRSVSRSSIFWSPSRGHVTKGQAWACILEFGPLPFREIEPPDSFCHRLRMRQKFPPPLKKSLRGTPRKVFPKGSKIATLTSCSGRAFIAHMTIFGAFIDRWRTRGRKGQFWKTRSNPPSCKPKRRVPPLADPPRKVHPMNFLPNWLRNSPCKFQPDLCSRLGSTLNKPARKQAFSADPGESPACLPSIHPCKARVWDPPVSRDGTPR